MRMSHHIPGVDISCWKVTECKHHVSDGLTLLSAQVSDILSIMTLSGPCESVIHNAYLTALATDNIGSSIFCKYMVNFIDMN